MSKINFGADFSSSTTLGPVASLIVAKLGEVGASTQDELVEATGRSSRSVRDALRSLFGRGLVNESERGEVVRYSLASRAIRGVGTAIREANLSRRLGVVVTGVPEFDAKRLRKSTFG